VDADTLKQKIKNLKNDKSAGEDRIFNEFLKNMNEDGIDVLRKIINVTILSGDVPLAWRSSVTTMLYKKGDKTDQTYHSTQLCI